MMDSEAISGAVVIGCLVLVVVVICVAFGLRRLRKRDSDLLTMAAAAQAVEASPDGKTRQPESTSESADAGGLPDPVAIPSPDEPAEASSAPWLQELYQAVREVVPVYQGAARPEDLIGNPVFERAVSSIQNSALSDSDLLAYYTGNDFYWAMCAAEAIGRREGSPEIRGRLLAPINGLAYFLRFFGLRAISARTPKGMNALFDVLGIVDESWRHPSARTVLHLFVEARLAAGEALDVEALEPYLNEERVHLLQDLLSGFSSPVQGFFARLQDFRKSRIDVAFLGTVGKLWDVDDGAPIVEHDALRGLRARIESAVCGKPPRSVLLVGQPGIGRTTLVRSLSRLLRGRGWSCFEAGYLGLVAGSTYVGQMEERLQKLINELDASRRIFWFVPDFHSLLFAGRHAQNPMAGALDLLMPAVLNGRIVIVGETEPSSFERLTRERPVVQTAFDVVRFEPLAEQTALEIAARWWASLAGSLGGTPMLGLEVLREASRLAQQYLGDRSAPGNLLDLLKGVLHGRERSSRDPIVAGDLVTALSKLTGLPANILDERQGLDLGGLRAFFNSRVMGQPEAVEALVERVAMIKAGVADPTRPLAVFLFAGPTGTGKTELAKALADYLFGSPDRMIRLDMSELIGPYCLGRLFGEPFAEAAGGALVDLIRQKPFSVVLLDEFEKADPVVWNMFLQVFDDGRLTDRLGVTADFRNAIFILTSNLGAAARTGVSPGFVEPNAPFTRDGIERAVRGMFRPELVNRIDRLVVFRPLTREVLRDILQKELREAFERRGLRSRAWAVLWDEAAIDLLLDRGVSQDLGARPLKRAIERHFLAPLATTIVSHQYPTGDQFLFVRSDGERLRVEFVDPDAPASPPPAERHAVAAALSLEIIALDPHGSVQEIDCLDLNLGQLRERIEGGPWRRRKKDALARIQDPEFWEWPGRFAVLELIEQSDRIEAGVKAASALFERLGGGPSPSRKRFAADYVGRLASDLFVLATAVDDLEDRKPFDAFLLIGTAEVERHLRDLAHPFLTRLAAMYRRWGERRGMRIEVIEDADPQHGGRRLFAVNGLGAHTLLAPEAGLHVFEEPLEEGRGFRRVHAVVRVAPQPDLLPTHGDRALRAQAEATFSSQSGWVPRVVRRYREYPAPLVRDAVRGWRTGRAERVFGGDFDLFAGLADEPAS